MVSQIYPNELQFNKSNSFDTEAPFLDLNLSITYDIVSSKIFDKRDDFNFEIVNFPFLSGDVPRSTSYSPDRYSNLFLNAYIDRHVHAEYLKMI